MEPLPQAQQAENTGIVFTQKAEVPCQEKDVKIRGSCVSAWFVKQGCTSERSTCLQNHPQFWNSGGEILPRRDRQSVRIDSSGIVLRNRVKFKPKVFLKTMESNSEASSSMRATS